MFVVVVKPPNPSDLRTPGACVETGGVLRFARGSCLPSVPLSLQERLVVAGPGNDRPSGQPPPNRQVATHRMRRGLSGLLTVTIANFSLPFSINDGTVPE